MDYRKHYDLLCERAKTRQLDCYTERHHVVPRCMGGDDSPDNLVDLTPEEHYVAHQLLVKMHPDHKGLVWAAHQMTGNSATHDRSANKLYGWLRRKNQKIARQRKGKKNGSYGKAWYYNPDTLENIKCLPNEVPEGFIKGRKRVPYRKCIVCHEPIIGRGKSKYCEKHADTPKQKRKAKGKDLAYESWNTFIESEFDSVTGFAESMGKQPAMFTQLWSRHIDEYNDRKGQGVSFKTGRLSNG